MKGALIGLAIAITLLALAYFKLAVYRTKTSIDFHVHDTYFVIDNTVAIVFALLVMGTFFSTGGLIGTQAKNKVFWLLAVLFLLIDTYYAISFFKDI